MMMMAKEFRAKFYFWLVSRLEFLELTQFAIDLVVVGRETIAFGTILFASLSSIISSRNLPSTLYLLLLAGIKRKGFEVSRITASHRIASIGDDVIGPGMWHGRGLAMARARMRRAKQSEAGTDGRSCWPSQLEDIIIVIPTDVRMYVRISPSLGRFGCFVRSFRAFHLSSSSLQQASSILRRRRSESEREREKE